MKKISFFLFIGAVLAGCPLAHGQSIVRCIATTNGWFSPDTGGPCVPLPSGNPVYSPGPEYSGGGPAYSGGGPAYSGGGPAYSGGGPAYSGGGPAYSGGGPAYSGGGPVSPVSGTMALPGSRNDSIRRMPCGWPGCPNR
jgi:hypothetical protein